MWKNALSAAAAAVCLAGPAIAAESSRLSIPNLEASSASEATVSSGPATLRPARIGIVEATAEAAQLPKTTVERSSSSPQKATRVKTSPPKEVTARKPVEKRPATSSRRTASPPQAADSTDRKIIFHPVEVVPLKEDSRGIARSQSAAPVGEVQYPVMPSESPDNEATAEYEEDYAPIVSSESQENFAPIISAADLPRPVRVRPTAGGESPAPTDVSLPPLTPKPVAVPAAPEQERPASKEPGRLSSILKGGVRLPEFRSRRANE